MPGIFYHKEKNTMENKLFSKFSFYDQLGYILVGSIALLITSLDIWLSWRWIPKIDGVDFVILIVVAYFLGHLIQSLANLLIKEKRDNFSEQEKEILNIAREKFDLKEKSDNEVYRFVNMISLGRDFSGQVEAFNAYYSLYRGWLIVFAFQSIFLFGYNIFAFNLTGLIFLVISIIVTVLLHLRMKRFYKYSREKTLQTFLIISKSEKL